MESKKPKVSVIIPCFNQGQYIDDAVESVLNQTFEDFEIILVNDGSTDAGTIQKLKNYSRPKCKVIHTNNQGTSLARNTGIQASSGEYILPLDADDKISLKYLEEAVEILDKEARIGIVYCEVEFFGEKTGKWNLPDFSVERILLRNMIISCALFRKSDYLKTNGYNSNMKYGWEDWDFWLSLIEKSVGVYKLPDVHFFYRVKNGNSRESDMHLSSEKPRYSLNTIYLNHFDLYVDKMGNPIELYSKLNSVLSSKNYKIGRFITYPARKLRGLLRNTFNNND
jgi:glycosyltransferase involved in cell wall biosynthesis